MRTMKMCAAASLALVTSGFVGSVQAQQSAMTFRHQRRSGQGSSLRVVSIVQTGIAKRSRQRQVLAVANLARLLEHSSARIE